LQKFHFFYGDSFKIDCPTGSGNRLNLWEIAGEMSQRLMRIFLQDEHGRRPVFGGTEKFQNDPHFRDLIPFHEYFHGDNGAGIGASHQTGWSGLVGVIPLLFQRVTPAVVIEQRQGPAQKSARASAKGART
jgi:hypothetical protein